MGADVEAYLLSTNALDVLAREPLANEVVNDNLLCAEFLLSAQIRIEFPPQRAKLRLDAGIRRQHDCRGDVLYGSGPGDFKALQPCKPLTLCALQVLQVAFGLIRRELVL